MNNRSIEEFPAEESSDKPEFGSALDIVNDYQEIKLLIEKLILKSRSDDPDIWTKNRKRLNTLLIKHSISPDDPECFKTLQIMAEAAYNDLDQEI